MVGAIRAIATARGSIDEHDFVVTTLAKPMGRAPALNTAPGRYTAELVSTDTDLHTP